MKSTFPELQHWRVSVDQDALLWLGCDRQGESANSLSIDVIQELDLILDVAETLKLHGLVLYSEKSDSFILGADIREFDAFDRADEVTALIEQGHRVFARLENLKCHKVAAIHGFALGGGLELALCCDYLLAMNNDATRLGFPEVKLGIFPGLGGTTRGTERIGGFEGMQLMLTGRMLRAPQARRIRLIDELVDEFSSLRWAARRAIMQKRKPRSAGIVARLSNLKPARALLSGVLHKRTAAKANPQHYPAPFSMIDLWAEHRSDRNAMFQGEAQRVGQLMVGDTARNLRRLFFLTERMKALGKSDSFKVRHVHVVGAGVMGGDIAAWCVVQGFSVTLQDRELKFVEPALQRAGKLFARRLKKPSAVKAAKARLNADVDGLGVSRADIVIEAIFEDAEAKRALYRDIEPQLKDQAVLATNTSALPLEELARDLNDPGRLIGLHFFNPVAKMPLVEVIHGELTTQEWIDRGCAFCNQINRFPLPTRSSPGFLVNRVLAPYLMQAFNVMLEGVEKEVIDAAAEEFGMPMGPIELADVVGLDVCMKVAESLSTDDVESLRQLLQQKIDQGALGKKTGRGFYTWADGKARRGKESGQSQKASQEGSQTASQKASGSANSNALGLRLIQPLLDECEAASAEAIVADDDLLDAGVVFGTGFAPFRGGPLNYLRHRGTQESAA